MLVMVLYFARRSKGVFHVPPILNFAVLAIHDQRDAMMNCHFHREIGLSINERLERVAQMQKRQLGKQSGDFAIWRPQNIVEAGLNKIVQILAPDFGRQ